MATSVAARNTMLDAERVVAVWVSVHTGDPLETGAAEATGGSPAYARKAITWSAASAANINLSGTATVDVPAGTYTHWGTWSAVTAGTFRFGGPLSATEVFAGQGQVLVSDLNYSLAP